jgi:outer membrane protein assembly factor BamA
VLAKRSIPGHVDYKLAARSDGTGRTHVFAVQDPAVRTCGLHVEGASAIPEGELLQVAKSIIGVDYSRRNMEPYTRSTMTPPYRQRGYLRATFDPPTVVLGNSAACDGVKVTLHVNEGMPYAWDHAEWAGDVAITGRDLDALLGLKTGEVAGSSKIDAGLTAIGTAYSKIGYVSERATTEPVLDDAGRRLTFRVTIVEGPQFHIGAFRVAGLSPRDVDDLAKKWKLRPGDIYDGTYLTDFQSKELRAVVSPPRTVASQVSPNRNTRTVDVTLTIK